MIGARVSPWMLTPAQAAVMDAVCKHGNQKAVAAELQVTPKTVEAHLSRASRQMRQSWIAARAVQWDRWRRQDSREEQEWQ